MSKIIWIDNLLLFKILKIYSTQYLWISCQQYISELDMKLDDIIFMKVSSKSYKRLGKIKAFNGNKIIISVMADIGIGRKSKIEKLHNDTLNNSESDEEIEYDGTLY